VNVKSSSDCNPTRRGNDRLFLPCLVVTAWLVAALPADSRGDGNETPGGVAGVASREVIKKQGQIEAAQQLFTAGSAALAEKSYGEAMDYFKAAFEATPDVPASSEMRDVFFQRYQSASIAYAEQMIEQAEWAEAELTLETVMRLGRDGGVPLVRMNPEVRKLLERLKSGDYYNMANSPRHIRNIDEVEKNLILAKGYLDLGDYDRAEMAYQKVLAIDPYSKAARRGLEEVDRHRLNYYDVARNQTRARKLAEVAAGWESPVPPLLDGEGAEIPDGDLPGSNQVAIEQKLKSIRIPRLEFNDARLVDVLGFLMQKSQELDTTEPDPAKRGVNIVVDAGGAAEGQDPSQSTLTLQLSNVPLGVAIEYAAGQVGMKYRVDNFAVTVIPESVSATAAMVTRSYPVPPCFISGENAAAGGGAVTNDPFAAPADPGGGALVKRITAKEFLEQQGVTFEDGAMAQYLPRGSMLIVRNTVEQLSLVETLIRAARESGNKMVRVGVKMITVREETLRESGMDFLLGQFNVGDTPRVFLGGGTDGNAAVPTNASDYTFVPPGGPPVGIFPVTSGLRTGDFKTDVSIDDVINRDQTAQISAAAPGVFAVSGVFTDPQFQAVIRALNQLKGSDTLSSSEVLVIPGQRAKIEQVREFIYPTEYDPPEVPNDFGRVQIGNTIFIGPPPPTFPVTPATPTAFETRSVGKTVEVEPTVAADNLTISVNVLLDFTDFTGFINYGTPIRNANFRNPDGSASIITDNRILMPVFDAVKETTEVTVWDGQTIVIGGLQGESVIDSEDKIPFVGDLPVIGNAFRSSTSEHRKQALMVFVTVRLVDPGDRPINERVDMVAE